MTIPEAAVLTLQAGAMGHGGEIFVLDMGEPVRILDLAKRMIELSEYRQSGEIDIVFTGASAGGEAVRGAAVLGGVDRQDAAREDLHREDCGGAGFGAGGCFGAAAGAGFCRLVRRHPGVPERVQAGSAAQRRRAAGRLTAGRLTVLRLSF